MIQSVPKLGNAKAKLLATLAVITPITIQVIGADTLYLAETDNALTQTSDGGFIDALQINQASGVFTLWWIGDLWAAGSAAMQAVIGIPGVSTGSGLAGRHPVPHNVLTPSVGGSL